MPEEFVKSLFRALVRNPARCFSMAVVGAITALIAVHIVSAAAFVHAFPQKPASNEDHKPDIAPDSCITMPGGTRVCESPEARLSPFNFTGTEACGFADAWRYPYTKAVHPPASAAIKTVERITQSVGLVQNFDIFEADFKNSATAYTLVKDHKRIIVYDRARFQWKDGRPDWKEMTIMAHEIGHHLNGHTLDGKTSQWPTELEADRFAGFVVSRLDGRLESALNAYRTMSLSGSKTHPPRAMRLKALESGWRHSERLKQRQILACNTDWLAAPVNIGGQSCRMATLCSGNKTRYRIACETADGSWFWQ